MNPYSFQFLVTQNPRKVPVKSRRDDEKKPSIKVGTSFWSGGSCAEIVGAEVGLDARVMLSVQFTEDERQQVRVLSPEEVLKVAKSAQAIVSGGKLHDPREVFEADLASSPLKMSLASVSDSSETCLISGERAELTLCAGHDQYNVVLTNGEKVCVFSNPASNLLTFVVKMFIIFIRRKFIRRAKVQEIVAFAKSDTPIPAGSTLNV